MVFSKKYSAVLKGIAILLVLENHWLCQALGIPLPPLGCVGVFIFLVLSGYGITVSIQNNNSIIEYSVKRIVKVLIPYVLLLTFMFLVHIINENISPSIQTNRLLDYLLFIRLGHGAIWYLRLNFYWYVIGYFILVWYLSTKLKCKKSILLSGLLVGSFIICILTRFQRLYVWQFLSFPLGIIIRLSEDKLICLFKLLYKKKTLILLTALTCVLFILKKLPYVESRELGLIDTVLQCSLTIVVGFLLIGISHFVENIGYVDRILKCIGDNSYELYLSHIAAIDYFYSNAYKNLLTYLLTMLICFAMLKFYTQKVSPFLLHLLIK